MNLTETIVKNEATGGMKARKLARFELIPADSLWKVAEHYGRSADKYPPGNWEKGYAWGLSIGAAERHLALWKQGEVLDKETGTHHLAAVVFHMFALMRYEEAHPELDDRPDPVRRKAGTLGVGEPAARPAAGLAPSAGSGPHATPEGYTGDATRVICGRCQERPHLYQIGAHEYAVCPYWDKTCPATIDHIKVAQEAAAAAAKDGTPLNGEEQTSD